MSWEIVVLLSVIVLCGTTLFQRQLDFKIEVRKKIEEKTGQLIIEMDKIRMRFGELKEPLDKVEGIETLAVRIEVLETNQITILKTVDEAKKMLSNQNLGAALGATGGFTSRIKG